MKNIENRGAGVRRRGLCRGALAAAALPYFTRLGDARAQSRAGAQKGAQTSAVMLSEAQLSGKSADHVSEAPLSQGNTVHLQPEATRRFLALREAAAASGIRLRAASGFRSFSHQLQIWNGKLSGRRTLLDEDEKPLRAAALPPRRRLFAALHWSALPGASRHHWGTDLDVYDGAAIKPGYRLRLTRGEARTVFADLHRWLDERIAADRAFGFYRPYRGQGGVSAEPWHLSCKPLAQRYAPHLDVDFLRRILQGEKLALQDMVLENLPQIHERFIAPYNEA